MDITDDYRVIWTDPALIDLDEIVSYIAKQALAPVAAERLKDAIFKETDRLCYMPQGLRIVHKKKGYRRIIVKSYNIYYSVDENKKIVYIMQVIHGRRNLPRLLR
jgi:toxin ParE1/3/4